MKNTAIKTILPALLITLWAMGGRAQTATYNYIRVRTPRIPLTRTGQVDTDMTSNTQVETTIQYMDGLGRPMQTVGRQASPAGNDIVQPFGYDQFSRDSVKYLPYTVNSATPGAYQPTAIAGTAGTYATSAQYQFYQQSGQGYMNTQYPYSPTAFEPSPLNRPVEQGAPGSAWQLSSSGVSGSGHTVKINYTVNNGTSFAADSVNGMQVAWYNATINANGSRTLAANGYYPAGKLTVTVTKDENWISGRAGTVEEYKDLEGQVILKRIYNYTNGTLQVLSTYYVYDDFGLLAFVLPPALLADGASTYTATQLNNLAYQYNYDDHGRMSGRKLPGKGWEYVVYNYIDQPVATQDSLQRAGKQWVFTKYDAMGRAIMTFLWNNSNTAISQATLQGTLNGYTSNLYETPVATGNGYTNALFPTTSIVNTLTLNYYDGYANVPGLSATRYTAPAGASVQTRGLPTAKLTAVLNTPANMLWGATYYDDLGRSVKTYAQHYLGGTLSSNNFDAVTTTYSFTNQATTATRQHWNTTSTTYPLVTIANTYIYDHMDRKLKTWEQITNGNSSPTTKTLIAKTDYNEMGQLLTKHLHSTDSTTFLQNIVYTYNERGWLTQSSAGLFEMQLQYNTNSLGLTGISLQYNGNIASQSWGTSASPNTSHYTYSYDKINRLTAGNSSTGNNENSISYDLMGNISTLNRYATSTAIDQLSYYYNSKNSLDSVKDANSSTSGLPGGKTSYTYDGNGNMLTAANTVNPAKNKSITAYNLLNLPQTVVANTSATTTSTLTYTYDAAGNKLRRQSTGLNNITDYISGIQYDGATTPALSFIQTEEGKAVPNGTGYDYTYYLGDNLGNTRVTFDTKTGAAVMQQQDNYYPFGLEIAGTVTNPKNEYLYNRKELQEELTEYDYGARFYDPVIGRWNVVDAYAEHPDQIDKSPYAYVGDNPINVQDPDGNCPPCDVPDNSGFLHLDKGTNYELEHPDLSIIHDAAYNILDAIGVVTLVNSIARTGDKKTSTFRKVSDITMAAVNVFSIGDDGEGDGFFGEGPVEPYNRQAQYGKTPTPADREALGADKDHVVNHEPPLVKRYHEGDPRVGEKPGHKMTAAERKASANDRSRMNLQPKKESHQQGAEMAKYSKDKNKQNGH